MARMYLTPLGKCSVLLAAFALLVLFIGPLPSGPASELESQHQHPAQLNHHYPPGNRGLEQKIKHLTNRADSDDEYDSEDYDYDEEMEDAGDEGENDEEMEEGNGEVDLDAYTCKGAMLLEALQGTVEEATAVLVAAGKLPAGQGSQSKYVGQEGRNARKHQGWQMNPKDANVNENLDFFTGEQLVPVGDAMQALGLSTSNAQGHNKLVSWEHTANYYIGSKFQQATEAEYLNVYNPSQGVLIAHWNYSPQEQIETDEALFEEGVRPPLLSHWSDIVFLEYADEANAQNEALKNLGYVFRAVAREEGTKKIVTKILVNSGIESGEARPWANKKTFGMNTDESKAILATANGQGVAWLLFQHKQQFGRKTVKRVHVFKDNEPPPTAYRGPSLLFELEDVA